MHISIYIYIYIYIYKYTCIYICIYTKLVASAVMSKTVYLELISTLGALFPGGGPVQDPGLTYTRNPPHGRVRLFQHNSACHVENDIFFFFTLFTGPRRSLSLKLRDTRVYEPQMRARLGTTAHPKPARRPSTTPSPHVNLPHDIDLRALVQIWSCVAPEPGRETSLLTSYCSECTSSSK